MELNFCMENGLETMETMDSIINNGGYGIWVWGINSKWIKKRSATKPLFIRLLAIL